MRVYKFQLKPSKSQEVKLQDTFKLCRLMYNKLLEELNSQKVIDKSMIQGIIPDIKICEPKFRRVYSKTLQYECYRLFSSLKGLSKSKAKGNVVGRLRFKGERWFKTITYNQSGFKLIKTNKHYCKLRLSKIGDINIRKHREVVGKIKGIIIKRKVDSWEAHIITDGEYTIDSGKSVIGLDMGVLSFITTSDNEKIGNPLFMNKSLERLQLLHKQISKTKKGSKNRRKICNKLQKVWEKIDNQKKDFFHKISTKIVNRSQFIAVEKLNIKSMTKNKKREHHNHRNILDSSWGLFLQMLKSKAENAEIKYAEVDPRNTSKMCHKCGKLQAMPLSARTYNCECGVVVDRDYNAARNILRLGMSLCGDDTSTLVEQVLSRKQEDTALSSF